MMDIKSFIEKYKTDEAFATKYMSLTNMEAAIAQAKEDGFDATEKDVLAVMQQLSTNDSKELNETTLPS